MSTFEDFLAPILADPHNDEPRLICADWLEERGDVRAEFIRLQCRLSAIQKDDPEFRALEKREIQLLRAHKSQWLGPIQDMTRSARLYRGFVEQIVLGARQFLQHCDQLYKLAPIQDTHVMKLTPKTIDEFITRAALSDIRGLHLADCEQLTGGHFGRLLNSPHLTGLTRFSPGVYRLTDDHMSGLANGSATEGLLELNLDHARAAPEVVRVLAQSAQMSSLRKLGWRHGSIGDDGVAELAGSPHLANLRHLSLTHADMTGRGLTQLAGSPILENLLALHLDRNPIKDPAAFRALFNCGCQRHLQTLSLDGNRFTRELCEMLAALPWSHLQRLSMKRCGVAPGSATSIAKSGRFPELRSLDLSGCPLGGPGAQALARSTAFPNLRTLRLIDCEIDDAGALAILESPGLAGLTSLALGLNPISDERKKALRKKYGVGVCSFSRDCT